MSHDAPHLQPHTMENAQRHLVAKALSEFAHERLLAPVPVPSPAPGADAGGADADAYEVPLVGGSVVYRFCAWRLALEHWVVDEGSLTRTVDGEPRALDAAELVRELQPLLDIPDTLLATYLEEVAATLAAAAYKKHQGGPTATELLHADFQDVESAMTEGHPGFVANNGRIGFGLDAYRRYAPEVGRPFALFWLAARKDVTHLALGAGLDETTLYEGELDVSERARFVDRLLDLGLDPASYRFLPVHPWQWDTRISVTFAPDVARRDLVPLGPGADAYQAQQSIRTMFNRSRPDRHYVKTALAIQNMGFLRGLSPAYMRATPAINDWVADLVSTDATLAECGFSVLRERASIGYTGDVYHRTPTPSAHRKMVAALWRESPVTRVAPGERLATMASLLHRDDDGRAYATALVRASGLSAQEWVGAYLDAYLRPVVHCLLAHDLAFMPHGENVILVLADHVPRRAIMKDIGEEVVLLRERAVPEGVARIVQPVDDAEKALAVFTDVFDGVLRHLAGILHVDGVLREDAFWTVVADCVGRHAADHPDLDPRVDLRADRFAHSCLNRLQLRNTLQMVDLSSQSGSLIYAGTLANPIARTAIRVPA
ncbi:IucA/IucC family siderophore biosynthesis protein [Mumia zhuanghuii]|uniref:IucA/IucC family protein n=2 Tax=Mumia TaxID=1546255 RepID=A0ABW1QJS0_9ACTN|nr:MULTISPECIES: IucA/IucC family protein [Mumia]KAA1419778.1 IucA/IucC family siderophore biosynthesis protein [Mumia zhuanghuii]